MLLEYLMFWARETFSNVRRNPLMSLLAISTVTVGLFILGAFYLALGNLRGAVKSETQKLDMAVILDRDISEKRRKEIFQAARIKQVKNVTVVLHGEVLRAFKKEHPDIPLEGLEEESYNPFSDELRIQLVNPATDYFKVRKYFDTLKGKGVLSIRSAQENDIVRTLMAANRFVSWAGVAALWVMGLAILLIIHNAIRLTIYARRREIRIMELVGATPAFIRIPFVLEGLLYGAVGALLASIILSPIYTAGINSLKPWTKGLASIGDPTLLRSCVGWMLVAGLLFGLLGSWFSVSRNASGASNA